MLRVDASYLYELGDSIRSIRKLRLKEFQAYELYGPLTSARQKTNEFISSSVYSGSIRNMRVHAESFLSSIDTVISKILSRSTNTITSGDLMPLADAYDRFEPAFSSELSNMVMYLVQPKGPYDVVRLVDEGGKLFPVSVATKCPEALHDITEGAKCLAFELWSAAAFHFHRANEAVLRRYFVMFAGEDLPNPRTPTHALRATREGPLSRSISSFRKAGLLGRCRSAAGRSGTSRERRAAFTIIGSPSPGRTAASSTGRQLGGIGSGIAGEMAQDLTTNRSETPWSPPQLGSSLEALV